MTVANLIGMANFFVKGKKTSLVLIGLQSAYLVYKIFNKDDSKSKSKKLKQKG